MQIQLTPYLHFKDNTRQAMEFYRSVFGGKLVINTFKEYHVSDDPAEDNKIMHAMLEGENGIKIMAADTPNAMSYAPGATITMALNGDNDAELRTYYEKLSAGGSITVPLDKTPWGDTFSMFTDRFGIEWMVDILAKQS